MLDITFIRQNTDIIRASNQKRGLDIDLKKLIATDDKRVAFAGDKTSESYQKLMKQWVALMQSIPNIPDMSVSAAPTTELERFEATENTESLSIVTSETFFAPPSITKSVQIAHVLEAYFAEIGAQMYVPKQKIDLRNTPELHALRSALPQITSTPQLSIIKTGSICTEMYALIYEGESSMATSLAWFEQLRTGISETFKKANIPFILTALAAPEMQVQAAKEYCYTTQGPTGSVCECARLTLERDFVSRETRRSYTKDGVKKYAHAITLILDTSVIF
jgi:seryl-tRNA synthetase